MVATGSSSPSPMSAVLQSDRDSTLDTAVESIAHRHGIPARLHGFILNCLLDVSIDRLSKECLMVASVLRRDGFLPADQVMAFSRELHTAAASGLDLGG